MIRPQIAPTDIDRVLKQVREKWVFRLTEKGWGTFASTHEIMGVVDEEVREMHDDVKANVSIEKELLDIIVAAAHGMASCQSGKMDW